MDVDSDYRAYGRLASGRPFALIERFKMALTLDGGLKKSKPLLTRIKDGRQEAGHPHPPTLRTKKSPLDHNLAAVKWALNSNFALRSDQLSELMR